MGMSRRGLLCVNSSEQIVSVKAYDIATDVATLCGFFFFLTE